MAEDEDPREVFGGTEKLSLPVEVPSEPACPNCGTVLIRRLGWKAQVRLPQVFIADALYCQNCDLFFVDLGPPVEATTFWSETPKT